MIQFNIGLSALQTAQQGLAIAGNNLANASTPGYHREVANLSTLGSSRLDGVYVGNGVSVTDINRVVSDQLDAALNQQTSVNAFTDASLSASTQIQQTISSGITSPATQIEGLLNSLQQLSASPTSSASQQAAVSGAQSVATAFNTAASDLSQLRQGLNQSINADVTQVNSYSKQIASLNSQISTATSQGINSNSLLDQRDQLVGNLAKLVNIQTQVGNNGQLTVTASGVPLVIGVDAQTITASTNQPGAVTISTPGSSTPLAISGGDLGGLLSQRNNQLVDYQQRLDALAQQVASSLNAIQSTGLGGSGGFTQLTGLNPVTSTSATLNVAGLASAPQNGSLFIGVTNTATGQRTLTEVPISPGTQSLQDVANSISGTVPNLQAYVNSQTGTMSIMAATGYTFDFTGGYEASPATNLNGASPPTATIGGAFTGSTNDTYTVTFPTAGTIGVTPNLQAQVTNSAGALVATVNVGQGYQAGQPLNAGNGLTLTLGTGDVASGDTLTTPVVGNPDSAGILSALGLNTLFTGNSAATLGVSSNLAADPSQLATSRSGQSGDTSNLQRFVALNDAATMKNGTQSFSQYSNQMVSDIGSDVQAFTQQQSTNQTLMTSITNQQQSVSGVDTNEELSNVMKYQQMFELAGKYISAVNDALQQFITAIH